MTMVQEVDMDPGEVYHEMHEPEHIELCFDGYTDTLELVGGVESLTSSQLYLQGALVGSGVIRYSAVTGNEGFLSNIGEGLQAAWEYIKNMFKTIWNAVFKKSVKDTHEKVDDSIKTAEISIKAVESPKVTTSNVESVIKTVEAKVAKVEDATEKKKLQEKVEDIKKAEPAKQVAEVKAILPEVFEKELFDNKALKVQASRLKGATGRLEERKKAYAANDDSMEVTIQTYLNGLIGLPPIESVKDLTSAKAFLFKAGRCSQAMYSNWTTIFNDEQALKHRIEDLEKQLNEYSNNDKNGKVKEDIQKLKGLLVGVSEVNKITETVSACMINMTDIIKKACIVVI